MGCLEHEYVSGAVRLPGLGLWLDAHEPRRGEERVFVSHAHADHMAAHREVILSEGTGRLMAARLPGERTEHRLAWRVPAEFASAAGGRWRITLYPAGHILGSAMALIESGGERLLYTGDFKLRKGRSAEACEPVSADTLVMETTFGRPGYRFPPTEEVLTGVVSFCRDAMANEETPVLLGYSLGKSQELLCGLAEAGLPLSVHPQVARMAMVYRDLGQPLPEYEIVQGAASRGRVLVCPPGANLAGLTHQLGPVRKAVLTGWAMDPGCRFRYQVDAAFPLSDHADYDDLLEFVRRVAPRRVLTLHGFAADFAATLRRLGHDAWALGEDEQLSLELRDAVDPGPVSAPAGGAPVPEGSVPTGDGSFAAFAAVVAAVGATRAKLGKVELLGVYLRDLADPDSVATVAVWLGGQMPRLQAGWAVLRSAVVSVLGIPEAEFRTAYLRHGETSETVGELFRRAGRVGCSLALGDVAGALRELGAARGPADKVARLASLLAACDASEARVLMKILTGDLRIGLKEGLVEDAVAMAFAVGVEAVRRAHLLTGDLGLTARLAREGRVGEATLEPFRPVKVMLASPEPTAEAVWGRVQEWAEGLAEAWAGKAWIEDKYDGIRCQLHRSGGRVALYSRDLKPVTEAFLEICDAASGLGADVILDGELVAMRGGVALPFSELQRRLGRRGSDLFLREEVPVGYVAFDLLWRDGRSWIDEPLWRRREELVALGQLPPPIQVAPVEWVTDPAAVEAAFLSARARRNEGLIIKSPGSRYTPGRRGLGWLKLKKAFATLDCVVVGVEYGHGKRKSVLSDYTFAVRDEASGALKTIGKAYTGLTDAEIEGLTGHFLSRVRHERGRYLDVEPDVVLEIAFDRIQASARHGSGLALRFPRILRVRWDKAVADIDTVRSAWALVGGRGDGSERES